MPDTIRIHNFLESSYSNGPGKRAVLWLQGCTLNCPGCFNPETHSTSGGSTIAVDALAQRIMSLNGTIEGITITGGEPLQQRRSLDVLLMTLRKATTLSAVLLTGFSWSEIALLPDSESLLASLDVVIAGRFEQQVRLAAGLVGSGNKTIHFLTSRYSAVNFRSIPDAEVIITADGNVMLTGIDPVKL
jgi:anaerobic ribonucleoside-triphosphate reductase activating protein